MLETKDLILDKAKFSDWEGMYENVWSHPESAKYMLWKLTTNEDDAPPVCPCLIIYCLVSCFFCSSLFPRGFLFLRNNTITAIMIRIRIASQIK